MYDLLVSVRDTPRFCVTPIGWISPRLTYAVATGGEKTDTGYRWHCFIGGRISDRRPLDIKTLDYFGLNMTVCDNDEKPPPSARYFIAQKTDAADIIRALNRLMIVDRKGVFPGDETTNLHLFQ